MNLLNKLTVKNLKLNKKRTVVTVIGIMLSVGLITAVVSVYKSGLQSIINYETTEKGAFHAAFYNVTTEDLKTIENVRGIDKIDLTKDIGYAAVDSKNEHKPYICIKGFTQDSLEDLSVNLVDGRMPQNGGEILIPTHLKTNGRVILTVGDEVTFDVGRRTAADGSELDQHAPFIPADENSEPSESLASTQTKTYKIVGVMERPAYNVEPYSAPGYTVVTYVDGSQIGGEADVYCLAADGSGIRRQKRVQTDRKHPRGGRSPL